MLTGEMPVMPVIPEKQLQQCFSLLYRQTVCITWSVKSQKQQQKKMKWIFSTSDQAYNVPRMMCFTHLTGTTQYHASEWIRSMPGNHPQYFPSFAFDASTTQTVNCSRIVTVANLQKIRNSLIQIPSDFTMVKQRILFAYIWWSQII